ncbi:hypothetical protein NQD34_018186 [Periophthalmus magnuspinnatus]|nr:hypothetical protein NQD34_018186 [Periophthalmus magnuspinnatus]
MKTKVPDMTHSGESMTVRAANGEMTHVSLTKPVMIQDPKGKTIKLAVLYFPDCPLNLLGRDALVALGLVLIPDNTGNIQVKRMQEVQTNNLYVIHPNDKEVLFP